MSWVPGSVKGCGEVKGAVPLQGVCAGSPGRQVAHGGWMAEERWGASEDAWHCPSGSDLWAEPRALRVGIGRESLAVGVLVMGSNLWEAPDTRTVVQLWQGPGHCQWQKGNV